MARGEQCDLLTGENMIRACKMRHNDRDEIDDDILSDENNGSAMRSPHPEGDFITCACYLAMSRLPDIMRR